MSHSKNSVSSSSIFVLKGRTSIYSTCTLRRVSVQEFHLVIILRSFYLYCTSVHIPEHRTRVDDDSAEFFQQKHCNARFTPNCGSITTTRERRRNELLLSRIPTLVHSVFSLRGIIIVTGLRPFRIKLPYRQTSSVAGSSLTKSPVYFSVKSLLGNLGLSNTLN